MYIAGPAHVEVTYRMPVHGWLAHSSLPIYNFELRVLRTQLSPTARFVGATTEQRMDFTGRVEEAKQAADVLLALWKIKQEGGG